jgi:hypothetical protein
MEILNAAMAPIAVAVRMSKCALAQLLGMQSTPDQYIGDFNNWLAPPTP